MRLSPARLLLVAAILLSGACGKRGDPLPPLRRFPAAVEEIRVAQRGNFICLEWKAPERNTDGSMDIDLEEAEVLRRVGTVPARAPIEGPSEEAPKEGEPRPQVPPAPPFTEDATVIARLGSKTAGERLRYLDPWDPTWEGKRLEYAVQHVSRRGRRSDLSPIAAIETAAPLEAPVGVRVEAGDGLVRVYWEDSPKAGEPVGGSAFNIYRRAQGELYPEEPLNRAPVRALAFEDVRVEFGKVWCYVVRQVAVAERSSSEAPPAPLREGSDSEEACLTPVDTFAPAVPGDLVALRTEEGVLLSWRAVEASDVRGYLVYRARQKEGPFELLTGKPVEAPSFTDRGAEPGVVYYYSVSAVDRTEPWNEGLRSPAVAVRKAVAAEVSTFPLRGAGLVEPPPVHNSAPRGL